MMTANDFPNPRRPCPVVTGLEDEEEEGAVGPVRHASIAPRSLDLSSSKRIYSAPCVMQAASSNILHFMRSLNTAETAARAVPRSQSMTAISVLDTADAQHAAEDEEQCRMAAMRVQAIKRRLQPAMVLSICKTCGVFICQSCRAHCCQGHTVFEHKFIGSPIARECGCKFKSDSLQNLSSDQHPQCCSRASLPRNATLPSMQTLVSPPAAGLPTSLSADTHSSEGQQSARSSFAAAADPTPPSPALGEVAHRLQRMDYLTAQDLAAIDRCRKSNPKPSAPPARHSAAAAGASDQPPKACACAIM